MIPRTFAAATNNRRVLCPDDSTHEKSAYMKTLTVNLGDRSYPIFIGTDIIAKTAAVLSDMDVKGRIAIVTDTTVGPLYADALQKAVSGAGFDSRICTLEAGEEHKRLIAVESLCGQFLEFGLDRSSAVIALGGGVVGDVAGFAAACFMRGIPYLQVPTTIVAQVDSSVGGKTAVNHPLSKNSIGAFHQPSAVIVDMALLGTLPDRELRAGLAEVIKHGIIADAKLFEYMERESSRILGCDIKALEMPILRSCEIKSAIVAEDELEHGVRANLNYGHTFGHAIESVTLYEKFLHGEAIALGMHCAGVLARDLGLVDNAFVQRQEECIRRYELPVRWPEVPIRETLDAMRRDKKVRGGTMKFVVADRIGHAIHRTDVTEEQAERALAALAA